VAATLGPDGLTECPDTGRLATGGDGDLVGQVGRRRAEPAHCGRCLFERVQRGAVVATERVAFDGLARRGQVAR
jgi:hypothetical protein